ncbi:methionine ABC transporter permease [Mogibacterium diversum]|jgi:D-methionine ABC transporter, permease protein|uniref:methionine ABC transporter permease n=1 Tax=Mogibacterium diversum TaxID=114527 RepID=UPI0027B95D7A|nr:methionine ABC transporter permease [Mogibacterium diversum]
MFSPESTKLALDILQNEIPFAIWETVYVTIISTFLALVVGLPLGVLLVVGEKDGILPLPKPILSGLNAVINLLRSIPFLILMIMVFPVTRFFAHTVVGTVPTIVPLVFAAFPFVARLVESSIREVDGNIIETAVSMGASPLQIIFRVLIPESVPSLISNITIALTTVLSYSAMSGIIGGGGLGKIAINYGYYRSEKLVMFIAVFLLIVLVQIFQTIGTRMAINDDKRIRR